MIFKEAKLEAVYFLNAARELVPTKEESPLVEHEAELAFLRGKKEGESVGHAAASFELRSLAVLLHTIADKLLKKKEELLLELKPEIIDFCFALAEKILRKELSHSKEHEELIQKYLTMVREGLGEPLHIFLSPEDFANVQKRFGVEVSSIQYRADPLMRRGDCRIEARQGVLNAEIKRQLEDIREQIS